MPRKRFSLPFKRYETAKLDMLPKMVQILRSRNQKTEVTVRCVFLKISHIDTVREQYYGDVFIQARWKDTCLNKDINPDYDKVDLNLLWNPKIYIENVHGEFKETISREIIFLDKDSPQGYIVEKRRIKAVFQETLELNQFPFDCQDLSIIVTSELSYEELAFVESPVEVSRMNEQGILESQEWKMHKHVDVNISNYLCDCNIGPARRPTVTFTCRASRRFAFFLFNYFLISCLLCLLAFCSLSVSPQNTFGRLQLCMIILLTTVTFKVAVSQNLPKIPYLTYLDKAILGNIFVIICLCLWHASLSINFHSNVCSSPTSNITDQLDREIQKIHNNEKILLIIFLLIYFSIVLVFSCTIYFDAGSRRRKMILKDKYFQRKMETIKSADDFEPRLSTDAIL